METNAPESSGNASEQPVFAKVAECLYRHASSGTYYGLVKRGGKQYRQSLKTKDRKLAERRLKVYRDKVGRLTQTGSATKLTFAEFAKRWFQSIERNLKPSSARRRQGTIDQLSKSFGNTPIRSITTEDCEAWAASRGKDSSASTFNNERGALQALFDFAVRDGFLLDNPARHLARRKMGKTNIVIPTREQFNLLMKTIRQLDARAQPGGNLVELLAYSGMRLAEATGLCWEDVDFGNGRFVVTGGEAGTKNHDPRHVPLFPALRQFFERLRDGAKDSVRGRVIQIDTAKKLLESACRKASLPDFTHHTLRHYFVSNAIEAGVDFKVIASWVGHKDGGILVAKTYGHLRDHHSVEMAKRMTFSAATPE